MKRIFFSLMLLLCVGSVFGQNADELIKRWKAHSSMSYEDVTDKVKKDCKEKLNNTTCIVKKGQVLRGVVSETECQQLQKDLNDLKGFKCVYHMKNNDDFEFFCNVQYYAIEDGEYIKDFVGRIDLNTEEENAIAVIRLQGKMKLEDVIKIINLK